MYLIQAVQTSWRPQLPLPKELHISDENCDDEVDDTEPTPITSADMHSKKDSLNPSQLSNASGSSKKWSFGRLFRKKKDLETGSSSEEDRKAGFVHPPKHQHRAVGNVAVGAAAANVNSKAKSKISRGSKLIGAGFDHIVVSPPAQPAARIGVPLLPKHVDHEFFLPVETVPRHEPFYQNEPPHNPTQDPQQYSRSSNSLDRRSGRSVGQKSTSSQRLPHGQGLHTSSEEELISLNSSTFSKYRSDESIHSGGRALMQPQGQGYSPDFVQGANGQSRRSRAARNERYYKRLSRDGEVSHGQVPVMLAPQPTQRWKTQPVPLSVYNEPPPRPGMGHVRHHSHNVLPTAAEVATPTPPALSSQRLRNTNSLQHVAPYVQWGHMQQQQQQHAPKNLQNSVNEQKRSISYDSHIHLQNVNGRMQTKVLPPPPPPRDPLRRVNVAGSGKLQNGSSDDLRPLSYAFDVNGVPAVPAAKLSARCVSDDKIWAGPALSGHYPSTVSVPAPLSRRFITRAERDANPAKKSLPNGLDFQYVADATPRSRKPIHMLEQSTGRHDQLEPVPPPSGGILRTTKSGLPGPTAKLAASDFWKRLDEGTQRRGRNVERAGLDAASKPRSISSSRANELRTYPIPMYTEVYKPNRKAPAAPQQDSNDGVVCGSLHIKPNQGSANSNYVEIRHKDEKKSHSMPGHYQRRSDEIPSAPNKYDEYVAEKLEQHHKPFFNASPMMPYRKLSVQLPPTAAPAAVLQQQPAATPPPFYYPRKKPANLEEAISELEAIYKSLGLTEPPAAAEKETDGRRPTPDDFEKFALAHADEYDDEDSPAGEPDPVRDDVAYRHIQLANLQHKASEKQPLFGIPIGPIVPAPQTDYLHVAPTADQLKQACTKLAHSPDVVKDDLAVRALRKDPPGPKDRFLYPASGSLLQKKNRATRTQSANIYSLIQRDAAKPAGGDIFSFMELSRSIDCSGSLSDLRKGDAAATAADDIPATLTLLRSLKEQELQQQQQQHGSLRKPAAPMPFRHPSQGGAISQLPERLTSPTHREEPHKGPGSAPVPLPRTSLTPEPGINHQNQMEDALNKIVQDAQESSVKLSRELQELRREALITATRPRPKINDDDERLEKDLQEIEAVSEAAKRCGQMLLETLPDAHDADAKGGEAAGASTSHAIHKPRKVRTEGKLIMAIDQVSEAANAVCEKILKDIVTTEPPVVLQHTTQVANTKQPEPLVMPNLIKKLDPIQSDKIEAIAKRCMRQLSELGEQSDCDESADATGRRQPPASAPTPAPSSVVACNDASAARSRATSADHSLICTVAEKRAPPPPPSSVERQVEEIDKIMQECEEQVRSQAVSAAAVAAAKTAASPSASASASADDEKSSSRTRSTVVTTSPTCAATNSNSNSSSGNAGAPSSGAVAAVAVAKSITSSVSSSSDCLAKSSSPSSASRRQQSSSITSFNPYSSSDYIKSPSSEYHAPSTDPIKTFSTTSYDVQSTSATPNITTTNSTFSYSPSPSSAHSPSPSPSPSPPLNLTPVSSRARTTAAGASSGVGAGAERNSEERLTQSSSSPSQYNSSEELAMIFGIEEKPKQQQRRQQRRQQQQQQQEQEPHQKPLISESVALQNFDIQNNSASCNRIARPLATATTSCQQQQQRPEHQASSAHQQTIHATVILNATTPTAPSTEQTPTKVASVLESATKTPKRYQGLHPHFHHHTAPAYYTDVHLRIHTPRASDVAALNENYRSVYATPSQLLDERSRFPKTISNTVLPPPTAAALSTAIAPVDSDRETGISATTNPAAAPNTAQQSRAAFFRGGSAGSEALSGLERSVKLSPTFPSRTKGKLSPYLPAATSQRATRSCRQPTHPAQQTAANSADGVADTSLRAHRRPGSSSSSGRSRNPSRFAGRKRAVRVRSESRPISALYDIICKEKGFDVCTTTTNDEDSSASNSTDGGDDERQRQRQRQRERDRSHELGRQRHNAARRRSASSSPAEEAEEVCCRCRRHANSAMSSRMDSPGAEAFKGGYHEQTHAHANRSMHIPRAHSEAGAVVPKKKYEHKPALAGANVFSDEECIELKSSPKKTNLLESFVQPSDQHEFDLPTASLAASDKCPQSPRIPVQCQAQTDAHTIGQPLHHHHHHHQHQNQAPSSCVCTPPPNESSELASLNNLIAIPTAKLYVEPVVMDLSGLHGCGVGANSAGGVVGGGSVGGATTTTGAGTAVAGSAARIARQGGKTNRANVNATFGIQATTATDIAGDNYADGVLSTGDHSAEDTDEADEQTKSKTKNKARRYITRPHRVPSLCSLHAVAPNNSDNSIISDCATDNAGADVECCAAYQGPDKEPATTTASLATAPVSAKQTFIVTTSTTSSTNTTNNSSALDTVIINAASASPAPLTARLVMTNSASKSGAVAAVVDAGRADSAGDGAAPANRSSTNDSVSTAANVTVIADKRKDDEQQQQHNSASSPTSPRHQLSRICGGGSGFGTATGSKTRQRSSSSDNQQVVVTADAEPLPSASVAAATAPPTPQSPSLRKLVPSVSVSMKQNLSELHYNGVSNTNTSPSAATKPASKAKKTQTRPQPTVAECTVKVGAGTPKSTLVDAASQFDGERSLNEVEVGLRVLRPRCSTMVSNETVGLSSVTRASLSSAAQARSASSVAAPDLSPVAKMKTPETSPIHNEGRDKSSKRKSNLNRSQNDEATHECDESAVVRRRRRRELGLSRQLIPSEDAALREFISPRKGAVLPSAVGGASSSSSNGALRTPPARTDLAFHMENARRGLDLIAPHVPTVDRRRAQTTSPKIEVARLKAASAARVSRRSDTLPLTELRKLRSNDVNRKLNDRTKSDLAEIMKIAEMANNTSEQSSSNLSSCAQDWANGIEPKPVSASSSATAIAIDNLSSSINCIHVSHEREIAPADRPIEKEEPSKRLTLSGAEQRRPAVGKHATFVRDSCVYYEPEATEDQFAEDVVASCSSGSLRQHMLKARSVERDDGYEPLKLSPILRRKSTDDLAGSSQVPAAPPVATHSHIVSILKKKDYLAGESSSASSNASPVTFSANVVDTPTKQKRAGILKKRSSLDESRYYSRSHSPDERSILIKSARRNSLEETAAVAHLAATQPAHQQHGILKQSSYDSSKSDGCPSATETTHPHGILKKKDSTSTPSDGGSHVPKHVSISQAVILAAAELSHETALDGADCDEVYTPGNEEYEIRPILKLESTSSEEAVRPPKPILKKKSSGDFDEHEIRPILKTSRKSSREEFDTAAAVGASGDEMRHLSETGMRPILKTELPSKHRSLGTETNEGGESTTWPSLLTRRTRSLERHDHPSPPADLAAAMNAITTSQASPSVSVDGEAIPPPKLSVAERIRNMELFLSSQHSTPTNAAANTTFESALQSSVGSKLMTPSAIKRDLYRDRYKTQPVTSDEKSFFRATYSPFDKSTPSAFQPAKPLHPQQAEQLRAPRTSTQPMHVAASSNKVLTGGGKIEKDTTNDHYADDDDSHISINDTTFDRVAFSDSERIFEMSGIDTSNGSGANNSGTPAGTGSGASVSRSNSVRARANMFQQLQEQKASATSTPSERTSPGRVLRRSSSPPTVPSPITPAAAIQTATKRSQPHLSDEEIETAETRTGARTSAALEPPLAIRGILKSKSGGVGFMPVNLNSELKNRLKCSTHASVGNLRKSDSSAVAASGAGVDDSQLTLGKSSSDQNDGTTAAKLAHTHDDAVSLVRNLSSLGRPPQTLSKSGGEAANACASTSEGESSGGREISEIIKNSAVARRRKQNDGTLIAKSKSHTSVPVSGVVSIGIGPQLPPFGGSVGFVKLRHVGGATAVDRVQTPPSSTTTIIVANEDQRDVATATSEASKSTRVAAEAARKSNRDEETVELREKPTALPTFLQGGQLRRCQTQVMGPDQRIITITKTGSIADRLAALQKSGEDDWKRRISKRDEVDEINHENFVNESLSLAHSLSDKPISQSPLIPTSLEGGKVSDRLGKLKSSSESWRTRVGQSDASKFTVAGRLQKNAQSSIELQFARSSNDVAKKCPMAVVYSAHQPQLGLAKSSSMMVTSALHDGRANMGHHPGLLQRCLSTTSGDDMEKATARVGESSDSNSDSDTDRRSNEKENKNQANNKSVTAAAEAAAAAATVVTVGGARVIVPRQEDDETFERFFSSKKPLRLTNIDDNVHIADFDNIKATPRLVTKRTVQGPKGRRAARNPLKSLAARTDIASEYTEVKTGIAEREMRRIQLESYGQRGNLAAEAIAGLASVEDFKAVALRSSSLPLNQLWVPYKPVMLLHVKGRTHVQTRLVEPTYKSLNRGDCFLLIVGSQLFRYVGSFANVIEISRSKKICAHIVENKDLGCTAATEIVLSDGKPSNERNWKAFWTVLGKPDDYEIPDSGHADEDDLFELSLIETNKIYEFADDSLMPFEKYWGCIPKVEMLDSRKVLVFDFGSELYVWNGKNAPTDAKRAAIKLAEEHFNAGPADYSECYVNPLNYAEVVGHRESYMFLKSCERRGDWCILGKITQNMETALFKEKFSDWPELEREDLEKDYLANGVHSVKALNGDALFKGEPYEEPNLMLENASLGRGHFYYDTDTMRHFDIVTKSTSKWRINEFNFDNAEASSYGHFYSAESYIVRWIYQISVTVRELSGKISNRSTVGRERCVYFCWQGGDASANEKGAAALLTVELDKEKGAQVRIAQGDESTAFVRLCQPLMVQHRGRQSDCLQRRALWRLYHVVGNMPEETLVKEVDCHPRQLRSRASLLLVHGERGLIFTWHGCQSAKHTREVATEATDALVQHRPDDIFTASADTIACEAVEEGSEPSAFREALGGLDMTAYCSLLGCATKDFGYTLRVYHFSSTQGVFSAAELQYALRCQEVHSPYPFTQMQLYNARQPTIFMLDDGDELWLWMGWWPLEDVDINAEERSSPTMENRAGVNRWISERRAALETAVAYWRSKFGDNEEAEFHGIRGNVVWAGLEPLAFQALFPDWLEREDVRDINVQDGRTNAATPIVDVLTQLTQTEYPLSVLRERPLPEGVDPTRLELYLNADDFQLALGVSRADFEQMPLWKQTNLKKVHELF